MVVVSNLFRLYKYYIKIPLWQHEDGKKSVLSRVFVLKSSAHKIFFGNHGFHTSARLQKVIKGLLSEREMDIASESDAKILNSAQKHFQVLYSVFCEAC